MPKFTQSKGGKVQLTVNCNLVVKGSKAMTPAEQEALDMPDEVRITISGPNGEGLLDEMVQACRFSTGSVGYKLNVRDQEFGE
jgi:hypothetical protein